ncbi:MAG: hypothetical protein EBZ67_08465 [Chitinophagia bacterium]|nr:hypothetical protein [Chitinophagia bacterium]
MFRVGLTSKGIDVQVLLAGNLLLYAVSLLGFRLHRSGMRSKGGTLFLGTVYGAFLARMAVCAAAVFAYGWWKRSGMNWPALFICMFLYLVYTFLETRALLRYHVSRNGKD